MEIYQNKSSGKYFVYIENIGLSKALFISPNGKIKPLELSLFDDEVMDDDEYYLFFEKLITNQQFKKYYEYHELPPLDAETNDENNHTSIECK